MVTIRSVVLVALVAAGCGRVGFNQAPATCTDGVQSGAEMGIDCGGDCAVCAPFTLTVDRPEVRTTDDAVTLEGGCDPTFPLAVNGASLPCTAGRYRHPTPDQLVDGAVTYTFMQGPNVVRAVVERDTTGPDFIPGTFQIGTGASTTEERVHRVTGTASDALGDVTAFCVRLSDASPPTSDARCWQTTSPAETASFDEELTLGFLRQRSSVFAFARDDLGNVSQLISGVGEAGTDRAQVTFLPPPPPNVRWVVAANTPAPSNLSAGDETRFSAGDTVFTKWAAESSRGPLSIDLSYTIDNEIYRPIQSTLVNGSNADCSVNDPATTVDDDATGCVSWVLPDDVRGFFRVRIVAIDNQGYDAAATSSPLNSGALRVLAGNTDPGVGLTARSVVFVADTEFFNSRVVHNLILGAGGVFYYIDPNRGIMAIDPQDGRYQVFIPLGAASAGDNGPARMATLRDPWAMTTDFRGGFYVVDHDRIRHVDTQANPPSIRTVVGGGDSTDDTVAARELRWELTKSASGRMTFFATPAGDLWFNSNDDSRSVERGYRLRIYRAATSMVESLRPNGTGPGGEPVEQCRIGRIAAVIDPVTSEPLHVVGTLDPDTGSADCNAAEDVWVRLDPTTLEVGEAISENEPRQFSSRFMGADGLQYFALRSSAEVVRLGADGTFEPLIGTGLDGECRDGTLATECAIRFAGLYVDAASTPYLMDDTTVRSTDAAGRMITLMGQRSSNGDGAHPLFSRLYIIGSAVPWVRDGTQVVTLLDLYNGRAREFEVNGVITTRAGNGGEGAPKVGEPANTEPLEIETGGVYLDRLAVDRSTGDMFYNLNRQVGVLRADESSWRMFIGDGSVDWFRAGGEPGTNISLDRYFYRPSTFAVGGGSLLVANTDYDPATSDLFDLALKLHRVDDGTQTNLLSSTRRGSLCDDGTSSDSCPMPRENRIRVSYAPTGDRWLIVEAGEREVRSVAPTSTIDTVATVAEPVRSLAISDAGDELFYCDDVGTLHRFALAGGEDTPLPIDAPGVRCAGETLYYVGGAAPHLVFPFTDHGLAGVAAYDL
ncbi:MAG: hypothetical protein AAGF12_11670 [Myxococcota bacterium]